MGIIKSCFYIMLLLDESWKSPVTLKQLALESRKKAASLIIQSSIRGILSAFESSEIVTCIIWTVAIHFQLQELSLAR